MMDGAAAWTTPALDSEATADLLKTRLVTTEDEVAGLQLISSMDAAARIVAARKRRREEELERTRKRVRGMLRRSDDGSDEEEGLPEAELRALTLRGYAATIIEDNEIALKADLLLVPLPRRGPSDSQPVDRRHLDDLDVVHLGSGFPGSIAHEPLESDSASMDVDRFDVRLLLGQDAISALSSSAGAGSVQPRPLRGDEATRDSAIEARLQRERYRDLREHDLYEPSVGHFVGLGQPRVPNPVSDEDESPARQELTTFKSANARFLTETIAADVPIEDDQHEPSGDQIEGLETESPDCSSQAPHPHLRLTFERYPLAEDIMLPQTLSEYRDILACARQAAFIAGAERALLAKQTDEAKPSFLQSDHALNRLYLALKSRARTCVDADWPEPEQFGLELEVDAASQPTESNGSPGEGEQPPATCTTDVGTNLGNLLGLDYSSDTDSSDTDSKGSDQVINETDAVTDAAESGAAVTSGDDRRPTGSQEECGIATEGDVDNVPSPIDEAGGQWVAVDDDEEGVDTGVVDAPDLAPAEPPAATSPTEGNESSPAAAAGAPPPPMPEAMHVAAEKLRLYASRNGEAFIALVRERERANPAFAFLLPFSPHHAQWKEMLVSALAVHAKAQLGLKVSAAAAVAARIAVAAAARAAAAESPHSSRTAPIVPDPELRGPSPTMVDATKVRASSPALDPPPSASPVAIAASGPSASPVAISAAPQPEPEGDVRPAASTNSLMPVPRTEARQRGKQFISSWDAGQCPTDVEISASLAAKQQCHGSEFQVGSLRSANETGELASPAPQLDPDDAIDTEEGLVG